MSKKSKYAAFILAVSMAFAGLVSISHVLADAQGGNNAATPDTQGFTLNTNYTPTATQAATLRSNLGVSGPTESGTTSAARVFTNSVTITGTTGQLILSGTPTTPGTGTIYLTGTSAVIYLTPTTGLIIASGTVKTF